MKKTKIENENKVDKGTWVKSNINKIVIGLVILVAFIGITVNAVGLDSSDENSNSIQGSVTGQEISLNTKIPGRIEEVYVAEGDEVKVGDPLVKISSDELEAKKLQLIAQVDQATAGVEASTAVVEMAKSNYDLSQARVEQAQAGVNASISQRDMASAVNDKAENGARDQQVEQAQIAYDLMEGTYQRAEVLFEGGAISLQKFEEIKAQKEIYYQTLSMAIEGAREEDQEAAEAQLSMAEAGVTASNSVLDQAYEASNIATAQITQAQAGLVASQGLLDQAQAGLLEVEVYLQDTIITASIDGTITTINSDPGELVSTGTSIGTITNLDDCWLSVDVDETKIGSINEGDVVNVSLASYPGEVFTGSVSTINDQPDFAVKKASNINGNMDIVSYEVKINIDERDKTIRPGMSATVEFNKADEDDV